MTERLFFQYETHVELIKDLKNREEMLISLKERLRKQEVRIQQYETMHLELYSLKIELLDSKSNIDEKNLMIKHLEGTCQQLKEENHFLKYPNRSIRMPPQIERENLDAFKIEANVGNGDGNDNGDMMFSLTNEQHSQLQSSHGLLNIEQKSKFHHVNGGNVKEKPKKKQENALTLAEKLKQSLTHEQQPCKVISPPLSTPYQQTFPCLVVKEVVVPKLPKDKTRSIMVRGLYRGIRNDDLMKYFAQFGRVVNLTSPPCVSVLDDGAKYAFLKYADYESVEKAVVQQVHLVKGIKIVTKKAKDFA